MPLSQLTPDIEQGRNKKPATPNSPSLITFSNKLPRQDSSAAYMRRSISDLESDASRIQKGAINTPGQAAAAAQQMHGIVDSAYRTGRQQIQQQGAPSILDGAVNANQRLAQGVRDAAGNALKTGAGLLAAPFAGAIDATRRGLTGLAGGDAATLPGGQSKYFDAAAQTAGQGIAGFGQQIDDITGIAGQAGRTGQQWLRGALGVVQAQPSQAAQPAQPARQEQQAQPAAAPAMPTPAQHGAEQERTAQEQTRELAGPPQQIQNRIVRDGNSFSASGPIREGATIGSTDMLRPGEKDDGRALRGITVGEPGDAQLAMERWARASQIRNQTRMEMTNPNPLTVIRDTSMGGIQGAINQRMNERDAANRQQRLDQHRENISQGRQNILDGMEARQAQQYQQGREALQDQLTQQQIAQGAMNAEQQQRMAELQKRIADPSLSPEERAAAERAYLAMSGVTGRDRYFQDETVIDHTPTGEPIRGKVTIDSFTGQRISQEALQRQAAMEAAHADARKAIAAGKNKKLINRELESMGFPQIP